MINKGYIKYMYLFIILSFAATTLLIVSFSYGLVYAKKYDKCDKNCNDQLIVKARIHLENIDMNKTKF